MNHSASSQTTTLSRHTSTASSSTTRISRRWFRVLSDLASSVDTWRPLPDSSRTCVVQDDRGGGILRFAPSRGRHQGMHVEQVGSNVVKRAIQLFPCAQYAPNTVSCEETDSHRKPTGIGRWQYHLPPHGLPNFGIMLKAVPRSQVCVGRVGRGWNPSTRRGGGKCFHQAACVVTSYLTCH